MFFNKIIPAVKGLLEAVYGKIDRDNAALLNQVAKTEESPTEDATVQIPEAVEEIDHDPDGFYKEV